MNLSFAAFISSLQWTWTEKLLISKVSKNLRDFKKLWLQSKPIFLVTVVVTLSLPTGHTLHIKYNFLEYIQLQPKRYCTAEVSPMCIRDLYEIKIISGGYPLSDRLLYPQVSETFNALIMVSWLSEVTHLLIDVTIFFRIGSKE